MENKTKKCCPNCSQFYNLKVSSPVLKGNIPLFLSCGHSVCESCIRNIIKFLEPIECKVCHQDMKVDESDLALLNQNKIKLYQIFPVNVHILGELTLQLFENPASKDKESMKDYYVDLKGLLKNSENVQGKCMECHGKTSKICQQCSTLLCEACFNKTHKNFVIFKNHALESVQSLNLPMNTCKLHNDKSLDYYCKDCSKAICMDCMMIGGDKSCKNHNVLTMQEVNEGFLEELNDLTPKVDETFRRLTKTAVDIGSLLQNMESEMSLNSELMNIINNIEQHFSKLCSIVQKHKDEVIGVVTKLKSFEKNSLIKAKEEVIEGIEKTQQVLKAINITSDPKTLKQINLAMVLEDAKKAAAISWYLHKEGTENSLKVTVNEDLCALISDYVHLEGNAKVTYSLCGAERCAELAPAPPAPVFPPQLPRDVRQLNEPKHDKEKGPTFYKSAPKYHSKSASHSSLNSIGSDSSNSSYKIQVSGFQHRPAVQQVQPFTENQPKQLQEGYQELIYVTHIVNPHNFYVQRACHQDVVKQMLREFRNVMTSPKPSLNHVAEGKIYLVHNKADNMWQRGRIVSIEKKSTNNPVFRVFCMDFGSTEIVTIDKLRLIAPMRLQMPPLAINCSLANCVPANGTWTSEDSFLVQNIINNKQAVIYIRKISSTSNYTVQLECDVNTFEHNVSLAHALVFHGRAKLLDPKLTYPKPINIMDKPKIFKSNDDFKPKSIEEVYITHIVSPEKFYVRKRHLESVYDKLCEDLEQEYGFSENAGRIYLPEIDMVCVVNLDKCPESKLGGGWARAVVTALPGRARVALSLPDRGAALLAHCSALRHIAHKYTTVRALATECYLAGITPLHNKWGAGATRLLQQFEGRLLQLVVDAGRRHPAVGVTLYDRADEDNVVCINHQMINHKFAITFGLYTFEKTDDAEEQAFKRKTPLDKTEPRPTAKTKALTILKRGDPPNVKENVDTKPEEQPLCLEAKVLYYQSPSNIYVSLVHQQKTFNELFEKMQKYYSKKKAQAKDDWVVGERCCTICIQSKTWRRAIILEVQNKNAKLFYSDFACLETVPLENLRELTPEFASIGDAAIKCHLSGVIPAVGEEWPSLTKEFLKELLDVYQRVFITKSDNVKNKSMPIEIWVYHTIPGGALEPNVSEWRCLNKKIIEQGLGVPDKSQKTLKTEKEAEDDDRLSFLNIVGSVEDWLQLEPLPTKPAGVAVVAGVAGAESPRAASPPARAASPRTEYITDWMPAEPLPNQEFTAMPTNVDNDGIIYLHDVTQQDTLDLIRKALDVRFKNPDPKAKYTRWMVGEPCIAMYYLDNQFYRGKVTEVNTEASTCMVHYIDYGSEEECTFANMRKSLALYQIPVQAHKCFLNRIRPIGEQWDQSTLDYIHKSIVEKQCLVKVCGEKVKGLVPIELKYNKLWLNDHLVDFEMAEYTDGSKAVIRKFVPTQATHDKIVVSNSGPDYIRDEQENIETLSETLESIDSDSMQGKDWNKIIEDEENPAEEKMLTFPNNNEQKFLCNINVINDINTLDLNIIHESETKLQYEEMYATLQEEGPDMAPLNGIFENKACVALFPEDGLWYRALILEYSEAESLIKVKYVDYGNIEVISISDCREITENFTKLPPANISVHLYGIKSNPNVDTNTLTETYIDTFLEKGPFHATIIKYENCIPLVELRNDDGDLIYKNLLLNNTFLT